MSTRQWRKEWRSGEKRGQRKERNGEKEKERKKTIFPSFTFLVLLFGRFGVLTIFLPFFAIIISYFVVLAFDGSLMSVKDSVTT